MAMSEPTQPLAGAPAAAAKARTSFGILGAISLSHLLNDMIQSLILAIYPLLQAEFSLTFVQIGLITLTFQLASSLLQPVVGYWTDKYPMPWSLPVGMCFTLSGLVLLAMAGSLAAYCSLRRWWAPARPFSPGIVPRGAHGLRRTSWSGAVYLPGRR